MTSQVTARVPTRILLVEDNEVYRATLELLLPGEGVDVVAAVGDGAAALAVLTAIEVDVALVDLRLPGQLAGGALVAALRAQAPSVPVVCVTAEPSVEASEAALAAGALTVLDKSLPPRRLADAVRSGLTDAPA